MADLPEVIAIVGPTASGKTAVGIALAQALDGEIISADARQVYRYMDIGTAKPTAEEQAAARHHLIDRVDPDESYSAGQFAQEAAGVIRAIHGRGKVPLVVGGAGLYLKALFDGFAPMPEIPSEVRENLQQSVAQDIMGLYARLVDVDPDWAKRIAPTDRQRIVRGLEIFEATGKPLTWFLQRPRQAMGTWQTRWFGLQWDRDALYNRIDRRAVQMVEEGLVDEVKRLGERGYSRDLQSLNTFGYREFFQFLNGEVSHQEALVSLQQNTRRYAKRQLTWFRAEERITWVSAQQGNPTHAIIDALEKA